MNDAFCFSLLKIATAQIIQQSTAFERIHGSTCSTITDVLARYLSLLGSVAKEYSHNANRGKSNALDVLQTLVDLGVDVDDLYQWFEETMEQKPNNVPITQNSQLTLQNLFSSTCKDDPEDWLVYEYRDIPEGFNLITDEDIEESDTAEDLSEVAESTEQDISSSENPPSETEEQDATQNSHVKSNSSSPVPGDCNSEAAIKVETAADLTTEVHTKEAAIAIGQDKPEETEFTTNPKPESCKSELERSNQRDTPTSSNTPFRPLYIPNHLPPIPEMLPPQEIEETPQVQETAGAQIAVVSNAKNDSDYNPYTHIIPFNESKISSTSDVSLLASISQIGEHAEESTSSTPTTPLIPLFDEVFQKALGSVSASNEVNGTKPKPIPYSYLERRRKQRTPVISSTISPYDTLFGNISTLPSTVDQILHQVAAPEVLYQYVSQPVAIFPIPEVSHFKMLNGQGSSIQSQRKELIATVPAEVPVVPSTRPREDSIKEPVSKKVIKPSAPKETSNHTKPGSPRPETSRRSSTPKIRLKVSVPTPPPPPPPPPPVEEAAPEPVPSVEPRGQTEEVINCICVNPRLDDGNFMIACDRCQEWFHGSCVGVSEGDIVDTWFCQRCAPYRT
ncbi:hypothetical protein K7432_001354 [Basidiobolus ranarum]|uniref:PHD-type domain-containing protein n=1 Tax=Basidiobolus ranarum TaxID=34480 RepID=A0ABR2W9R6_9FUNG